MTWKMMCCRYCGRDEGGPAGIFDARDRGETIERFAGPAESSCPCKDNPYTVVFEHGERVGKLVLKSSLPVSTWGAIGTAPKNTQPKFESSWDIL